ncbi:unnamed protein product [Microthlaspi erraticum]|uniref:Reverse transcriptase zinc-binding domain-containing protein n=1 Tax=Microthlaspi erraticum TaxID=1685480 RepID=A0A6D2K6C4_9BRAS|nr:unnamed protein product [Microthlaspi erraticum]
MLSWNIGATGSCIFCGEMESRNHLFLDCEYSEEVWYGEVLLGKWEDMTDLLLDEEQDMIPLFILKYAFQTTVYWIWRERNGRRHGDKPALPTRMQQFIDKQIPNRLTSIRKMGDGRYKAGLQTWFANS